MGVRRVVGVIWDMGIWGAFTEIAYRIVGGEGIWAIGIVKVAREWRLSPNSCMMGLTEETSTCIFE